jgi:hypothetical protein
MMRCYFSLIYDYEALEEGEELIPLTIYDWKTFEQFMLMDDYEEKEENLFDRIR